MIIAKWHMAVKLFGDRAINHMLDGENYLTESRAASYCSVDRCSNNTNDKMIMWLKVRGKLTARTQALQLCNLSHAEAEAQARAEMFSNSPGA